MNSNDSNNVEGNKKKKKKKASVLLEALKATAQFHCLWTQLPEANSGDSAIVFILMGSPPSFRAHLVCLALTACAQVADAAVVDTG